MDGCDVDHRLAVRLEMLVVFAQATVAREPRQGAFHDPALRQGDEPALVGGLGDDLEGQPEPVRRLMTETSLFDEVTGPMADAVTGMEGCADMLARLSHIGAKIELITNATIVSDKLLSALLDCDMRQITFSFDVMFGALQIMQAQCTEMGVVVHRVYHNVPLVQVDMAQIEQVIFNLYMNAVQAMPDGGVLTVSCQVVPGTMTSKNIQHEKDIALAFDEPIGVYSEQQNWLELSVSDTGAGIAPDQLKRIFQPFFTTKAHGIGLGLPITRRLVEDHHGHLLVESQPGFGTTISVRLPIVDVEI